MEIITDIDAIPRLQNPVVTVGAFDGIHLGHRQIFETVKEYSRQIGGVSVAITFDPHPQMVLHPNSDFFQIFPLEEKIKLLVGKKGTCMNSEDLNGKVFGIQMSDGPIGPHYPAPLLWLPSITCLSNTWSTDIVEQYVDALSDICVINDVDMLLAPAINIKKNPLCGRNFEYFSEDPFLTGTLARQYVSTLQNRGVSCCIIHIARTL